MVQEMDAEGFAGFVQFVGHGYVAVGGFGVAGRMVMHKDDGGGVSL